MRGGSRPSPPCSSSAPRGRAPARPGSRAPRRARPSLQSPQPGNLEAHRHHAFLEIRGTGSYAFLNECHQVGGDRGLRLTPYTHAVPVLLYHDLLARLFLLRVGLVAARVAAPALGPPARAARWPCRDHAETARSDHRG